MMRVRALLVDNDPAMLRFLRSRLSVSGYDVGEARTGECAMALAAEHDIMILDPNLPDMDGTEIIRRLRDKESLIPIVVLSGCIDERAKVRALDLGANDYVVKPFGVDELMARLRAAHRHRLQQAGETPIWKTGDLTVDLVHRHVAMKGRKIRLSAREFNLLRLLVAHAGKVLTHQFILRQIWGGDTDVQYIRIYIRALRQKIEPYPDQPQYILTEIGVGYRLRPREP
jgi:two-component system KDP operon response regulator KdpE